jgi:hypothetical protein
MDRPAILHVVAMKRCGGHVLQLRFNDGVEKRVNLLPLFDRGAHLRLRDPAEFARVRLDRGWGVLCWPGNLDIAPEALHDLPEEPERAPRRAARPRARLRRPARR